ncbi:MAG: hypothetical protein C0501_02975 [Isosphaera sp.]|nr:hypothetical protein [Isosphaera sp.]
MSLSRWKVMAGVLGVSLGGLAAASQCPKSDGPRQANRQADPPALPELPGLPTPPATGGGTAPKGLPTPSAPAVPAPPVDVPAPAPAEPPSVPAALPPVPVKVDPAPAASPEPKTIPPLPALPADPVRPVPVKDSAVRPAAGTAPRVQDLIPPAAGQLPPPPLTEAPPVAEARAEARPAPAAGKYRILLQVGEGEPRFEVKSGDDLVLKVVCERVDVKSPERGAGPSAVTAAGRVRFVGFGAEGTCDGLSFLAGTGEVVLTGAVKVQVKDKLGRVESELSAETMKYKIDGSAVVGALRP